MQGPASAGARCALALLLAGGCGGSSHESISAAELGKLVFFDQALSQPPGQACADCHDPAVAYRDPESDRSTSSGSIANRFGARNAPTVMYARYVPPLRKEASGEWFGGLFWDGRGGSLEEQAASPLLNPIEMNNPDKATVVRTIRAASYAPKLDALFGAHSLDEPAAGFAHVSEALAAFERTPALAPFTSKYDHYLAGTVQLAPAELRGLAIFEDPKKGNCASCHPSRPAADGSPPLFTNFGYANLGIPKYGNSQYFVQAQAVNPAGADYVDHGLMVTVKEPAQDGKFRTPTLRNIGRTNPYGHNGYFENLPYLLDFLNTRDSRSPDPAVKPWAPPEVPGTVDQRVGHLGLTPAELDDLDAFLETLSDVAPPAAKPKKR